MRERLEDGHGEFLLEVRAEEIPARMLPLADRELRTRLFEELVARRLTPGSIESGFTPRRLWLTLERLPLKEPDRPTVEIGPPVAAAFDAAGNPTAAALGFARKLGVDPSSLRRKQFGAGEGGAAKGKVEGERIYVERVVAGRSTSAVLAELVPDLLRKLPWAKTMRWGSGTGPWVRPVHGVVALLDGEVVAFDFFGVAAGRASAGHPTLSAEPFEVSSIADWRSKLAARGIVPAPAERWAALESSMRARAAALGGDLVEDADLLGKLAAICEIPGVTEGAFDAELLALPREVLVASLRDHQSALTVELGDRLAPVFLTVMDRPDDPKGRVRAGNEWVVAARLADARFFWEKDRSQTLDALVPRLELLSFHEKLGHYSSKWHRMDSLASKWTLELGLSEEENRQRVEAQTLLKVDLTTEMVREFTSLQGVMGGIYARAEGRPEAVWQAIYDQYLPAGTDDPLPRGPIGRIAALADRLDTLVGFFGLGLVPTGSKDPYGLRRAALAVVRLLLEGDLPLGLEQVSRMAWKGHVGLPKSEDETWAKLRPFYEDRVRYLFELRGLSHDEIEAGLGADGTPLESLPSLEGRVRALHDVRDQPQFLSVVLSYKRLTNILREVDPGSLPGQPNRETLGSEAEKALLAAAAELQERLSEAGEAGDFGRALESIEGFAPPLEKFFVDVLVMDPDPEVRRQRLGLLAAIRRSISSVADLSAMVVDKAELRARGSTA